MRYIVATHSFLSTVEINSDWGVEGHHILNCGHHYGITSFEKEGKERLLVKNKDTELVVLEKRSLTRADESPLLLSGNMGAVHQIACSNGGVYLANTKFNSLVFVGLDSGVQDEYHFNGKNWDYNHVNSIYPCGSQVYALLHNRTKRLSELAILDHAASKGFTLKSTISLWDLGCHNIYVDDIHLYYNASSEGLFVAVDLEKEEIVHKISFPGHTKGLSVTEDHFVVGFSDHAERSERYTTNGYLAVIDRRSLVTLATIDLNTPNLPHAVGNVNEVRCLSEFDYSYANALPLSVDWSSKKLASENHIISAKKQFSHALGRLRQKLMPLWG